MLIDATYLVNLDRRAVVWRYNLPSGKHVTSSPYGKHWLIAPYGSSTGPWHINALRMPGSTVIGSTEFNSLERQLVLYPGMNVGLYVQLNTAVGKLNAEQIRQGLVSKLTELGFKVNEPNPEMFLTLSTRQGSTGDSITVGGSPGFGFRQPTVPGATFSKERVTCALKLTDKSGKELWKTERSVSMRSFGLVNQENAQNELRAEMLASVEGLLSNGNMIDVTMPSYLFKDMTLALSGESNMALNSEGTKIDPVQKKKDDEEAAKRRQNTPARSVPGLPGGFRGGFPGGIPGGSRIPGFPGRGGSPF